ncbi:MAG: outer membrane lipoprotein carrier protein LolA [bacterium]
MNALKPRHPEFPNAEKPRWLAIFSVLTAGLFCLPISIFPDWASAASDTCKGGLTGRIQADYRAMRSFKGRFDQVDQNSDGQPVKAKGEIYYLKPGKMRWVYAPPNDQVLVTDGKTVWLHDPILDNVTVQALGNLTRGTPLAFLLGAGDLNTDFICRAQTKKPPADGLEYVELVPRKAIPALKFIQLGAKPGSARIAAIRMIDTQGNVRSIRITNLDINVPLKPSLFTFKITPDMEVITK